MGHKFKIKLQISYNGAHYEGWQKQKHETRKPTLQETVEKTLSQLLNEPISVCASGRTDAGVHAINPAMEAPLNLIHRYPLVMA